MGLLIFGLFLFFGAHSVSIVNESWRDRIAARLGATAWKGLFSCISGIGLLAIIWGYADARQDPMLLYAPPAWLRHSAMVLLIPVFPLVLAAYLPGRIQSTTKHPMLTATKFWALAHLMANGMLADVLLFGSFLLWAGADRYSMKYRRGRRLPQLPASGASDLIAVVLGFGLYIIFILWLHAAIIGVSPLGN